MKKCIKCNNFQNFINFHKHISSKDGYRNICKNCRINENRKKWDINYRNNNKTNIKISNKLWYLNNKESKNKKQAMYQKNRYNRDLNFKLRKNLRTRISVALQRNFKSGSAIQDLGCTIEELKLYLELKFKKNMSWENYGLKGWHIDHIIPLCNFDLTDRKQFLKACHYTNLQPLWWEENLSKQKYWEVEA